ncbi:MAG: serine hydrolase domain-containing protein, partial [Bacteroidota bacterium]
MTLKLSFYLSLFCIVTPATAQNLYFPPTDATNEWETISPATLGWCQDSIDALYDFLAASQTKSFVILKDGKIVLEEYFGTFVQDSIWPWFSAGKSLRSLLVGIAQEEGFLDIHDRTSDYLGQGWSNLPPEQEDSITVWHQLTMTAGLNELFFDCITPECLTYRADAGTRWAYHNGPYNLLKDVLETTTGSTQNALTNNWVEQKIGMSNGFWFASGNNTFYLSKARDMARFGLLMQNRGWWGNTAVLADTAYYHAMISPSQGLNPSYGYLWWLNGQERHIGPGLPITVNTSLAPDAPSDVYTAAGGQGQFISIAPSAGLIMIRQGLLDDDSFVPIPYHNEIWRRIDRLECISTA